MTDFSKETVDLFLADPAQRKAMFQLMKQARRGRKLCDQSSGDIREMLVRLRLKDDDETHRVLHSVAALEGNRE
jgi:hypothetical protein